MSKSEVKKRGRGRNKSRAKKREYQAHCRQMRRDGYVTDSQGVWTLNYRSLGISDASVRATTGR